MLEALDERERKFRDDDISDVNDEANRKLETTIWLWRIGWNTCRDKHGFDDTGFDHIGT